MLNAGASIRPIAPASPTGALLALLWLMTSLDGAEPTTVGVPYSCNATNERVHIASQAPLQGFIASENYPRSYPSGRQCTFSLEAPRDSGLVIHFAFIDVDLEERFSKSSQCLRDYIRFLMTDREGREHVGPRICGGDKLPAPIRGMQSKVDVLFVSSFAVVRRRGFKIRFEFIPEVKIGAPPSVYEDPNTRWQRDCGGTVDVSAPSAEIRSPGFPMTYPRDVVCNWLIRVEPHERVYVRLIHLELSPTVAECERASLAIVDGYHYYGNEASIRRPGDSSHNGHMMKYCGGHLYYNEEGLKSYLSVSNRVVVRFVSRDQPTPEQFANYRTDGTPIGFRLLWTKVVNSVIVDAVEVDESALGSAASAAESAFESECKGGFLCKGGEFCLDDDHSICAQRSRLCINASLQCNGVANCAENDDSDEYHCYSRGTVTLVCAASFVIVLLSTLFLIAVRSLVRCGVHRRRLKSTREYYAAKVGGGTKSQSGGATPGKPLTGAGVPAAGAGTAVKSRHDDKMAPKSVSAQARQFTTVAPLSNKSSTTTPKSSLKSRRTTMESARGAAVPTVEIATEPFDVSAPPSAAGEAPKRAVTLAPAPKRGVKSDAGVKETQPIKQPPDYSTLRQFAREGSEKRDKPLDSDKVDSQLPECNCDSAPARILADETAICAAERLFSSEIVFEALSQSKGAPPKVPPRFYGNIWNDGTASDEIRYRQWNGLAGGPKEAPTPSDLGPQASEDSEPPIWQLAADPQHQVRRSGDSAIQADTVTDDRVGRYSSRRSQSSQNQTQSRAADPPYSRQLSDISQRWSRSPPPPYLRFHSCELRDRNVVISFVDLSAESSTVAAAAAEEPGEDSNQFTVQRALV